MQVWEVLVELRREQHSLVDQGAAGEARHVPGLGARQRRGADLAVGTLADHVELALEVELLGDRRVAPDEHLAHERLAGAGRLAEHAVDGRHGPPADDVLALGLHQLLELLLDLAAHGRVAWQEDDAAAVLAGRGQGYAGLAANVLVEGVGHLDEDPGAVAGIDLAATGASVVEVLQDLDGLFEDPVGLASLDVYDEADATGVVLEARVVQPLFLGGEVSGAMRFGHRCGPACRSRVVGQCVAPSQMEGGWLVPAPWQERQDLDGRSHMTRGPSGVNAVQHDRPGPAGNAPAAAGSDWADARSHGLHAGHDGPRRNPRGTAGVNITQ